MLAVSKITKQSSLDRNVTINRYHIFFTKFVYNAKNMDFYTLCNLNFTF